MEGFIPDQAFGEDGGNNERFTSANKLIADELMYCSTISQDYVPRNYIPDGYRSDSLSAMWMNKWM